MNKQVLIVDDSREMHAIMTALLVNEGVDVTSAIEPSLGLTLASSMKPDLVLLDVDMPGMDGYEFCRRMKADAQLWAVPVIFLTARGGPGQKTHGLNLGAVDYIGKPFDPGELQARVRAALRTQAVIVGLESRSLVDALTGLGNGRMFKHRLRAAAAERARSPRPLTCQYVDVDGFGAINRHYGEPFGDLVLRKVADALRDVYRVEDVICRLGNDEFAVMSPDTGSDDAVAFARDFGSRLGRSGLTYRDATVPVTCGIGIATATDPFDQGMLERAIRVLSNRASPASGDIVTADGRDAAQAA